MAFSHLEVLSEVLVAAPPIGPDHTNSLVSSDLMEVRVPNVILLSINWESAVRMSRVVLFVGLSQSISPMFNHSFLLW